MARLPGVGAVFPLGLSERAKPAPRLARARLRQTLKPPHSFHRRLVDFINARFVTDFIGRLVLHPGRGYGDHDALYVAHGSPVLTRNEWVGRGLRAAFEQNVLRHL